jgi:protein arginine kinase activator
MMCQNCKKNQASVHLTEVHAWSGVDGAENEVEEKDLCEVCAQHGDLPFVPPPPKIATNLWGLLNMKAAAPGPRRRSPECPECRMSLDELRRRGRLGCAHCYETFSEQLEEMFERMHGATSHVGRVPGLDSEELERLRRVAELRRELESSIAQEAYERAASIRDELAGLDRTQGAEPQA